MLNALNQTDLSDSLELEAHVEVVLGGDDHLLVLVDGGRQIVLATSHTTTGHRALEHQLDLDLDDVILNQGPSASTRHISVHFEDTGHGDTRGIEETAGAGGQQVAEQGVRGTGLGGLDGVHDGLGDIGAGHHAVGIL